MLTDLGMMSVLTTLSIGTGAEMPLKSYDEGRLLDAFRRGNPAVKKLSIAAQENIQKTDLSKFTQAMKYLEQSHKEGYSTSCRSTSQCSMERRELGNKLPTTSNYDATHTMQRHFQCPESTKLLCATKLTV
jgi:hypothetical protein